MKNIIASVMIGASFFLFFAFVLPEYGSINVIRAAVSERQTLLEKRSAMVANVQQLKKDISAQQANITSLQDFLPTTSKVEEIIANIDTLTSQNGVQLKDFTIGDVKDANVKDYQKTSVDLNLSGTYASFLNFTKQLERNLRLSDVSEISMAKDTQSISSDLLMINLKMQVYSIKNGQ